MSNTKRTKVRKSFTGLLLAYLRNGSVDMTNFTSVVNVSGAFPFGQGVWSFTLGSEVYLLTYGELSDDPIWQGVSVQFGLERPHESHAMPQLVNLDVNVVVRAPITYVPTQESVGLQIAKQIDLALYQNGARLEIKDYDVYPATTTNTFMSWQKTLRGTWAFEKSGSSFEQLRMKMMLQYSHSWDLEA